MVVNLLNYCMPTQPIRNLQLSAGEPGAFLDLSNRQSRSISQNVPNQELGGLVELLKQYQRFGQSQELAGQQQQIQRATAPLPQDLAQANLSPQQILGFRRGEIGAVEPTIGGARNLVLEATRAIQEYQETQKQSQQRVKNTLDLAAQGGSIALEGLLKTNPEIFKLAGLDAQSYLAGIKARETEERRKFDIRNVPIGKGISEPGVILSSQGVPIDTTTGKPVKLAEGDKKLLDAFNKIDNTINQLESVYSRASVKTGFAPLARLFGVGKQTGQKLGLTGAAVREYEALVNASVGPIARAVLGEVGVLTDKDVARARGALPSLTDTPEEARRKMANMRQIVQENRSDFFARLGVQSDVNNWEYIP